MVYKKEKNGQICVCLAPMIERNINFPQGTVVMKLQFILLFLRVVHGVGKENLCILTECFKVPNLNLMLTLALLLSAHAYMRFS